jgi:hypothetical protein
MAAYFVGGEVVREMTISRKSTEKLEIAVSQTKPRSCSEAIQPTRAGRLEGVWVSEYLTK